MVKYFYGPDTFAAREEIDSVSEKLNANIRWLDKEDFEDRAVSDWLDGSGGLFETELLVLRDPSGLPKALQDEITEQIDRDVSWVVWDRAQPDKRKALYKSLKKHGTEFTTSPIPQLVTWLCERGAIDNNAAQELVQRVGSDRWRLSSELDRLLLLAEPVILKTVEEHVPVADVQEDIFAMLDALSSGNNKQAVQKVERLLRSGESELYILSMLAYQFKTLVAIKTGMTDKLHPFVVQKNQQAVKRMSASFLQNALARILATDFSIKQGKVDARTGLMMLVIGLAGQASA